MARPRKDAKSEETEAEAKNASGTPKLAAGHEEHFGGDNPAPEPEPEPEPEP